ncbi:MAG: rRNA maturation RNase YbeY [Acidimicrobiales bacterium]
MTDTVTVVAHDEQDVHPVDLARYRDLALHSLAAGPISGPAELNLLFVDEDEMAELNRVHMHEVGATDVLSFPIDDHETNDPGPRLLGDVVICPPVAARYAAEHGRTYDDELALLVVHGVLHVLGMDHAETDEAQAMQARERELLHSWSPPDAGAGA